jgi:uncharacterized protein (UPF0276 family)
VIGVGMALPPDEQTLDLLEPLASTLADYYEVTPETLWRPDGAGRPTPNGFHRRFLAFGRRTDRPFVAHGVGLSVAGNAAVETARRQRWLARIAADQKLFRFRWYTDHLGISAPGGDALALPLPPPMTAYAAALVRRRLARLAKIVPHVGLENTAHYFLLGDPLDEPRFISRVLAPPFALLLDLHNVHTMAVNMGFDPQAYLRKLPLTRVMEIHVSGGSRSPDGWLPGGARLRLDSHDGAVPEAVWRLLEWAMPRCPNLQGITLERIEGSIRPSDGPLLAEELRRLRRVVS